MKPKHLTEPARHSKRANSPQHAQQHSQQRLSSEAERAHKLLHVQYEISKGFPNSLPSASIAPGRKRKRRETPNQDSLAKGPRTESSHRLDRHEHDESQAYCFSNRPSPTLNLAGTQQQGRPADQIPRKGKKTIACPHTRPTGVVGIASDASTDFEATATHESQTLGHSVRRTKREAIDDPQFTNEHYGDYSDVVPSQADDDAVSVTTSVDEELITPIAAASMGLSNDDARVFQDTSSIDSPPGGMSTMFGYTL
jgi:hypothetical protein